MKKIRLAKVSTLLAGILFFLGFAVPADAGTCYTELKQDHQRDNDFCNVISGEGDWVFIYTVTGRVNDFQLAIKNNTSAADFCWGFGKRKPTSGMVTAPNIPAATEGACGDQFPDTNGDPLTVTAVIVGDAKGKVTISVEYPDP